MFGFAHWRERTAIGEAYRTKYPAIQQEIGANSVEPHGPGLLDFIREEIVDLKLIQVDKPNKSTLPGPQDEEEIPLQRRENSSAASPGEFPT